MTSLSYTMGQVECGLDGNFDVLCKFGPVLSGQCMLVFHKSSRTFGRYYNKDVYVHDARQRPWWCHMNSDKSSCYIDCPIIQPLNLEDI